MKNHLIERYGTSRRFVNWRLEKRGDSKATKVPYQANGNLASTTDPRTWATHELAAKHDPDHIGIVLFDKMLLCIDLDMVLADDQTILPEYEKMVSALLAAANSFTEISQSGHGLHIFIELTDPLTLTKNKKAPAECYTSGRYIAMTGNIFGDKKEVRVMTAEEAYRIVEIAIPQTESWDAPINEAPRPAPSSVSPSLLEPLPDAKVLEGMFAASNGAEIKTLYETSKETTKKGDDLSRIDASFLSHLAFWCQKDAVQMERIWLASPLGKRQKTTSRKDYRDRTIANAIAHCSKTYTPSVRSPGESATPIDDPTLGLLSASKGRYFKNTENITRVIMRHPEFKGTIRFDNYTIAIERYSLGAWRSFEEQDIGDIQTRISVLFSEFANIGKEMVYDAVTQAAHRNKVDTGMDYLRGLVWDKTPRLDEWIPNTYHTPSDAYHRAVGANWVKGMVKRIMEPGCKFDYVLVLEGPQGSLKSTSLKVLAGTLGHLETSTSTENKDFFMQLLGNSIVEFSEGETLSRTEVKRMKSIITVDTDKFRAPYARNVASHARRSVFAMTTNESEYLKDTTGNRRWLPVAVIGKVDKQWLVENREQILAEAVYRVVSLKETTWELPEQETLDQQQSRRTEDPNSEPIVNWYVQLSKTRRDEGVSADMAFREALNNGFSSSSNHAVKIGISDTLKNILMLERRRGMINGVRLWRWYPTAQTPGIVDPFASFANANDIKSDF